MLLNNYNNCTRQSRSMQDKTNFELLEQMTDDVALANALSDPDSQPLNNCKLITIPTDDDLTILERFRKVVAPYKQTPT